MEYLEVFVTKKPKDEHDPNPMAREWGDGLRWSEDEQLVPYIMRRVKNRHLVCQRIEEAFKDFCFVFGDGDGLVQLVILDGRSTQDVMEQVKELIAEHKNADRQR